MILIVIWYEKLCKKCNDGGAAPWDTQRYSRQRRQYSEPYALGGCTRPRHRQGGRLLLPCFHHYALDARCTSDEIEGFEKLGNGGVCIRPADRLA